MTLKNLSSDNTSGSGRFRIPHREITKRRLWVIGLTALMFIIYFIVGMIIMLASVRSGYNIDLQNGMIMSADDTLRTRLAMNAAEYFRSGLVYLITFVAAVVSGIQGYSYLHSKKAVDFYESQPVSRKSHFIEVFLNSLLIYLVIYIAVSVISLLIAAAMGAGDFGVFVSAVKSIAVNTALFLACFSMAALSDMLTGNAVVSICAAGVLFFYEPVMRFIISALKEEYFMTYPSSRDFLGNGICISPFSHLFHEFGHGQVWHNLVFAAVAMLITYFCYTKRKNESAGSAVVFRIVRVIVKIAVAVIAGLFAGWIFSNTAGRASSLVMCVIAAVVISCVMEIIYAYNFKALFRNWPATLISAVLGAGILLIFMLDVFGYDSWMPKEGSVESAAVSFANSYVDYVDENGQHYDSNDEYYKENMHVTDIGAVTDLVNECREEMDKDHGEFLDTIHVYYKMKNGNVKERKYNVSATVSPGSVSRLLSDKEFKEGYYPIYHSEYMDTMKGSLKFSYSDGRNVYELKSGQKVNADAFRNAYLADMEKLDYEYMLDHRAIGSVAVGRDTQPYINQSYTVYEGFDNTIAFLENEGIDVAGWDEIIGNPERVTIRFYEWPAFEDYSVQSPDPADKPHPAVPSDNEVYIGADGIPTCVYTDKDKVKAITDSLMPEFFDTPFNTYIKYGHTVFDVELGSEDYGNTYGFIRERVPSFVFDDFSDYLE